MTNEYARWIAFRDARERFFRASKAQAENYERDIDVEREFHEAYQALAALEQPVDPRDKI
jgi:hypothetical protein